MSYSRFSTVSLAAAFLSVWLAGGPANGATFQTIYNFAGGTDGYGSESAPVVGSAGVLYGATTSGGDLQTCNGFGCGTIFSLTPPAAPGGTWTKATLWLFGGPSDGEAPYNRLIIGAGGALYGVTEGGGDGTCGCGTVFSLSPPTSPGGSWTEAVIHSFAGGSDGAGPETLTIGPGGVLYGTTGTGGTWNQGTVYSLTPPTSPGGAWTEAIICSFEGGLDDGASPISVVLGHNGVLYGVTVGGGSQGSAGTVFSLVPPATPGGSWVQRVLYRFNGHRGDEAESPLTNLVIGSGGVLYGTTGNISTVFSLAPPAAAGDSWTETVLCPSSVMQWVEPRGNLVMSPGTGAIYGASATGGNSQACGNSGCGAAWALTPPASAGGAWTFEVLHSFSGPDGQVPFSGVTAGPGALYGTTLIGGLYNQGTVFAIVD